MADAPLPCLPPGWESEWATALARPLADVLDEGAGPGTLPAPETGREREGAETEPQSPPAPSGLRRPRP
jgi:hypothetical protein